MQTRNFPAYLQHKKESCLTLASQLESDDRYDEAVIQKVRANLYDIFATIHRVHSAKADRQEQTDARFLQKLGEMKSEWQASGVQATAHGDMYKAFLEDAKVAVATEIRHVFLRMKEEQS